MRKKIVIIATLICLVFFEFKIQCKAEIDKEWYVFVFTNDDSWSYFREKYVGDFKGEEGFLYAKRINSDSIILLNNAKTDAFQSEKSGVYFITDNSVHYYDYEKKENNLIYQGNKLNNIISVTDDYVYFVENECITRVNKKSKQIEEINIVILI